MLRPPRLVPSWVRCTLPVVLGWAVLSAVVQHDGLAALRVVGAVSVVLLLGSWPLLIVGADAWLQDRAARTRGSRWLKSLRGR